MAQINSFRDLNVYKLARTEAREIFLITQSFPAAEKYSLTDQIRRSSQAVSALLAEAWARRPYPAAFANKVNEALGEAMETQAWLDHSLDSRYITPAQHRRSDAAWQSVGAMLQRMMDRTDDFRKRSPKT